MIRRPFRPFLLLLPVLLALGAPLTALAANTSGGVYQVTLLNHLPKEMTVDLAYTSVETNQEVRKRVTVPANQPLQFTYNCAFGYCVSAYLNVLGVNDYVACTSQLKLEGGVVAVALKDLEGPSRDANFSCEFMGDGFIRPDQQHGVYGIRKMF